MNKSIFLLSMLSLITPYQTGEIQNQTMLIDSQKVSQILGSNELQTTVVDIISKNQEICEKITQGKSINIEETKKILNNLDKKLTNVTLNYTTALRQQNLNIESQIHKLNQDKASITHQIKEKEKQEQKRWSDSLWGNNKDTLLNQEISQLKEKLKKINQELDQEDCKKKQCSELTQRILAFNNQKHIELQSTLTQISQKQSQISLPHNEEYIQRINKTLALLNDTNNVALYTQNILTKTLNPALLSAIQTVIKQETANLEYLRANPNKITDLLNLAGTSNDPQVLTALTLHLQTLVQKLPDPKQIQVKKVKGDTILDLNDPHTEIAYTLFKEIEKYELIKRHALTRIYSEQRCPEAKVASNLLDVMLYSLNKKVTELSKIRDQKKKIQLSHLLASEARELMNSYKDIENKHAQEDSVGLRSDVRKTAFIRNEGLLKTNLTAIILQNTDRSLNRTLEPKTIQRNKPKTRLQKTRKTQGTGINPKVQKAVTKAKQRVIQVRKAVKKNQNNK